MAKKKRRRGRIKIKTGARLVNKNDATRVAKPDTTRYTVVAGRPPANNGATFKLKIRRR